PLPAAVGPWRPTDRLGAGGMGVVYAAERTDESFQQRAALKLIRPGFGADFRERFLRERALLAGLDHPGVARLLDGGLTDDGLPYLAMELVEGEPITDYAEANEVALRDRLGLFLQACDAVAHAHHRLVVHRDLKPAHILVTSGDSGDGASGKGQGGTPWAPSSRFPLPPSPRIKLLDFGIAKLLDAEADDDLTRTGGGPVTLQYAAPEQLAGGTITTATDVYALGLVLYELLTGQRPYDVKGLPPTAAARVITEAAAPRPSATEGGSTDTRRLRGDLDTVVLKALAKEPDRRYASAEALADDLRRYLGGLPVRARPDTWGYRARKFVRRHRASVAAGAVALAAVVGGAGVALWQARVAEAERDRAVAAQRQAEGTLDYLQAAILLGDPQVNDEDPRLSAVLDSASARVDAEADTAVAGAVHLALANVYLGRGDTERAAYHGERAADRLGDDQAADRAIATTYWAQAVADGGDPEAALPIHEQALDALAGAPEAHYEQSVAHNVYGTTLSTLGRNEDAEREYRQAIDAAQRAGRPLTEATALQNLANLFTTDGRLDEAIETLETLIATYGQSDDPEATYGSAFVRINLANTLANADRPDEAVATYREAVAAFDDRLGADHPETLAARTSYANHLHTLGRFGPAADEIAPVLGLAEATLPEGHPYLGYAQTVGGKSFCDGGDPARGADLLRTSLEGRRASFPPGHWAIANTESVLGACLGRLGDRAEAERLLASGAAALAEALGPDDPRTRDAQARLAAVTGDAPR
ncbi:MAG: serine/threonine-protein kinase, partial [Bacteroidota bacterium]